MADTAITLIPGTLEPLRDEVARLLDQRGSATQFIGPITLDDIDCGYAHIDNDVCVATAAMVGQYVRYFKEHGTDGVRALAPELCRDCRAACTKSLLASALERGGFTNIAIEELSSLDVRVAASSVADVNEGSTRAAAANAPVVGVCGNVPVITTGVFNSVVVQHLQEEGCRVVMPPVNVIANLKDFLEPALTYFDELGIQTVICILPFGCLGGHVFARGQLRTMQKKFPHMGVTMLDYDPSASDINLINRTELVIQMAKEMAEGA